MQVGVFIPVDSNGWLISTTHAARRPAPARRSRGGSDALLDCAPDPIDRLC